MLKRSLVLILIFVLVERTVTGCGGKLKAAVVKQKIVQIGAERRKIFPSRPETERIQNGLSVFVWGGGGNRVVDPNWGKEKAS